MVEMVETAAILNQASVRSFVVLDEIGRGTATFDGLSIAWATLEYLHEVNRCRVLFATHYHELTALADRLARAANATVEVKEWRDEIVFLYRVVPGAVDRSYGIHVAKLAGLPAPVLARANEVLTALEKADGRPKPSDLASDLPLFSAAKGASPPPASAIGAGGHGGSAEARRHDPQRGSRGPLQAQRLAGAQYRAVSPDVLDSTPPMDQAITKTAPYFDLDVLREETSELARSYSGQDSIAAGGPGRAPAAPRR